MTTIEQFDNGRKVKLFDLLEQENGSYRHIAPYYENAISFMAEKFMSGVFSTDDVSLLAEELFTKANESSVKGISEIPNIYHMLIELEWDVRNNRERFIKTVDKLVSYVSK